MTASDGTRTATGYMHLVPKAAQPQPDSISDLLEREVELRSRYSQSVGMKATTVRFGEDLWSMLERESDRLGVSAAQFVREATIMRLAMLAGARGDRPLIASHSV